MWQDIQKLCECNPAPSLKDSDYDIGISQVSGSSLDSWAPYCTGYKYQTKSGDRMPPVEMEVVTAEAPKPQESLVEEYQEIGE